MPGKDVTFRFWRVGAIFSSALLGASLVLIATTRFGAGVSPDSVRYLTASQKLASGGIVAQLSEISFTAWPPLYPVAISLVQRAGGFEALQVARFLNALFFFATILLFGYLAQAHFGDEPIVFIAGLILVATNHSLLKVSLMAWSDAQFILLTMLFVVALRRVNRNTDRRVLVFMTIMAALAALTRYSGIALLAIGVVVILWHGHAIWPKRLRRAVTFGCVGMMPLGLWMGRNHTIDGTFFGSRSPFSMTIFKALHTSGIHLAIWFLPLAVVAAVMTLIGIGLASRRHEHWRRAKLFASQVNYLLVVVIVYLAMLLVTGLLGGLTYIDDKYLAPAFIPVLLIVLAYIAAQTELLSRYSRPLAVRRVVLLLLSGVIAFSLAITSFHMFSWIQNGIHGYTDASWHRSRTIGYLRKRPKIFKNPVYSNGPDAIRFWLSEPSGVTPDRREVDLSELEENWLPEEAVIIWFENIGRDYLYSVEELNGVSNLCLAVEFDDGAIYEAATESISDQDRISSCE